MFGAICICVCVYLCIFICFCVYLAHHVCLDGFVRCWQAMGRLRKPAREEAPSCSLALPLPSLRAVVWHLWHLWQLCGTDGTNGNCVASQMAMSCRVCVCRDRCVLARALARRPPSFAQSWMSQVLFLATFILPTAPITLFRDKVSSPVVVVLHQTLL